MQGFKASAVGPLLGENMPNIKLWSDIAPCNVNRVLPYESILCLSNFKMGTEAVITQRCWKLISFRVQFESFQNGVQ